MATRLARKLPVGAAVHTPVNAVLCGRRNNPPDAHSKPPQPALAVHNPVHYYELPELFMELASSMTGKSPSTTGAGSEGALTKGPFNALNQIHDLNNALVSYALTGYDTFITSAGVIGPYHTVDHDISLLVPEVWSRMRPEEQKAEALIKEGYLEKIEDFEVDGKNVPASILGYRITRKFVLAYFGRVVADPATLFSENMLRPEKQDPKVFADGVDTIVVTNKRVAQLYFDDGAVEYACPPMKALLHIMRDGHYNGKKISDPEIRSMFTKESILKSDWYKERLATFQKREGDRLERGIKYMQKFISAVKAEDWKGAQIVQDLQLSKRLERCQAKLAEVQKPAFLDFIHGSLGVDPALYKVAGNNYDRPIA